LARFSELREAMTVLATIESESKGMQTLAMISLLALLAIGGAAYTDKLLTSEQTVSQRVD
jgi:hypothetical protein